MPGRSLSPSVRLLWAKSSRTDPDAWLPLFVHMSDAAGMAARLWKEWLAHGVRKRIAKGLGLSIPQAKALFIFLAAAHDLGKATPVFQERVESLSVGLRDHGLSVYPGKPPRRVPHSLASQAILQRADFDPTLAVVVGGHHGLTPKNDEEVNRLHSYPKHTGFDDSAWQKAQKELLDYAASLAGADRDFLTACTADVPTQVLLSALTTMADWLASDEALFPYFASLQRSELESGEAECRINCAWGAFQLPAPWNTAVDSMDTATFCNRFQGQFDDPRPLQRAVLDAFLNVDHPGIVVIEAPMGEGKTEAALAVAEMFAHRTERNGLFFALPTQATSNGLFPRLLKWINALPPDDDGRGLILAHGKSHLNEEFKGIPIRNIHVHDDDDGYDYGLADGRPPSTENDDGSVVAHAWFKGRRKSMLAGFVVGTIDQLLMAGLRQKHQALRHVGLANKVVVIDECHAYDAYMNQYLFKTLRWLGAYGVPVIVLSATLPGDKRRAVIEAYLGGAPEGDPSWTTDLTYPLITYSDGRAIHRVPVEATEDRSIRVALEPLEEEALVERVATSIQDGGCAGVVVNTVGRAQALRRALAERLGEDTVFLLHSRFLARDRAKREDWLRERLGPPGKGGARPERWVVVGTQVMEQSLDVDFDVMFCDMCPMDLLIQRIGRLHRHQRPRPKGLNEAKCYVLGMEEGDVFDKSTYIYDTWSLLMTRSLLREHTLIHLPEDIAPWVNRAYTPDDATPSSEEGERLAKALEELEERKRGQRDRAKAFQIENPPRLDSRRKRAIYGWLMAQIHDDISGKRAEATVRDSESSIEVIVIEERSKNKFSFFPWIEGGAILSNTDLNEDFASIMAECTVSLPRAISAPWREAETIKALEEDNLRFPVVWRQSPWIRGELILAMRLEDGARVAELDGWRLTYDRNYGLMATREDEEKS